MKLTDDQKWGRAEAYFVQLAVLPSLQDRLILWNITRQFQTKLNLAHENEQILELYTIVQSNEYFLEMLGIILAIGNVLNGGTPKGQADGFDIKTLNSVVTFKDSKKHSMLSFICKKMLAAHQDFPLEIRDILSKFKSNKKGSFLLLDKICGEMKTNLNQANEILQAIKAYNDKFVKEMQKEVAEISEKAAKYFTMRDNIKE
jgi:hypothetical protein